MAEYIQIVILLVYLIAMIVSLLCYLGLHPTITSKTEEFKVSLPNLWKLQPSKIFAEKKKKNLWDILRLWRRKTASRYEG